MQTLTQLINETEITSGSEDAAHMRQLLRFTLYPLDVARGEREKQRERAKERRFHQMKDRSDDRLTNYENQNIF